MPTRRLSSSICWQPELQASLPPSLPAQALDDRVSAAREAYLARQRAAGNTRDPFAEEERRQAKLSEQQPRSPAAQAAALHAAQHQQLGGPAAAHMPALLPAGGWAPVTQG